MLRRFLLLGTLAGLLVALTGSSAARAQSAPEGPRASLAPIKQAIIASTGYDAASIELTATAVQFIVTVVNSKLVSASGRARENEASKIVTAIARASADNAEFRTIQAIHVDYVSREPDGSHSRTVDAIDFQKHPRAILNIT